MSDKKKISATRNFVAGGIGGICTVLSGHPFDTIKVRLQTMPIPEAGKPPIYNGAIDCFQKTVKLEGFKGLYKGMGTPIVAVAPIFALSFSGFAAGKRLQQTSPYQELSLSQLAIAGAISGVLTTIIMAPGERIKCLLQVQQAATGPPIYSGPIDVIRNLWNQGGIKSIYKGTYATLLRDTPASAAYFGGYEIIQRILMRKSGERKRLSIGSTIFAGGMAGIFNWIVAIPPDVLKSRLQTAPEGKYKGIVDVFKHLIKTEGIRAMYKGCTPVMLRAFPANACCFLGYEGAMWVFDSYLPDV